MMGVEILATKEVATTFTFNWGAFWLAVGIIFGMCVIAGIVLSITYKDWSALLLFGITGIIFGSLIGVYCGKAMEMPTEYETHYKVIISDEVSMNKFIEKYEIIDQEGKIYTVREIN